MGKCRLKTVWYEISLPMEAAEAKKHCSSDTVDGRLTIVVEISV